MSAANAAGSPAWSPAEASALARPDEVQVLTTRRDGSIGSTIIWAVAQGNRVFIRSVNGPDAAWYRRALARPGGIRAGGAEENVTFTHVDADVDLQSVDAAYRHKYGRYASIVDGLMAAEPRSATLEVLPRTR